MGFFDGIKDFFRSMGTSVTTNNIGLGGGNSTLVQGNIPKPKDPFEDKKEGLKNLPDPELQSLLRETLYQVDTKRKMMKALYDLRGNDIVQTIIDVFIDDGLVSSNDNKIFNIKYKGETQQEVIQDCLDKFVKQQKLDRTVLDFIDEAILYGEYMLPFHHEKGKGVYQILDNADMLDLLAVYEGQEKVCFLHKKNNVIEELPKDTYIHFVLSNRKVRVEVKDQFNYSNDTYQLSQYIKVGKSIIFPVINKLKQLETLEMANLALDLKKILAPVVVMVGMPDNTQTKDIGEIVETYEGLIKKVYKNLGNMGSLKPEDLMNIAADVVVLPSIGNTKGSIQTLTVDSDKESNAEKEEMLRKIVALTIGMPFYYLSLLGEQGMSRLESLKLFARYSRKLNNLQDCIIEGIKELLMIHLKDLGYFIDEDDLHVGMRQITNVELLDSMEYLVALITALQDLLSIINSINDNPNINIGVDSEKLLSFFNKLFSEFPDCENLLVFKDKTENSETQNNFSGYRINNDAINKLTEEVLKGIKNGNNKDKKSF